MRTTVSIDDHLLASAKARARELGKSLGGVIEEAIQLLLTDASRKPEPFNPPTFKGTGVRPGVDLNSNRAMQDLLDEDEDWPLDKTAE